MSSKLLKEMRDSDGRIWIGINRLETDRIEVIFSGGQEDTGSAEFNKMDLASFIETLKDAWAEI